MLQQITQIKMKTIQLKIYLVLSFLIIIIPGEHVALPNGLIILFGLFQSFWSIFYEEFSKELFTACATALILCCSLLFIISKNKVVNLLGVVIQIVWLIYMFKYKFLNYWYYTLPISIYLISSLLLTYLLFFKQKK